jgi:hypothetical protein
MEIDTVYCISYFPDDASIRKKRIVNHRKMLDYWVSRANVLVYAQNYEETDFDPRVKYITNNGPVLRPGPARNELLKVFYSTTQDYGVFVDDDITLYEGEKYCDSDNIIDVLRKMPILKGVGMFAPLNPTQTPFSDFYQQNETDLRAKLMFKRQANLSGACLFLKNVKKHHDVELYYPDLKDSNGKVVMGEDILFSIEACRKGIFPYTLLNCVRKDLGWTASTWVSDDEHRKQSFDKLKEILINNGIQVKGKNKNLDWSGFMDSCQIPKQVFEMKDSNEESGDSKFWWA